MTRGLLVEHRRSLLGVFSRTRLAVTPSGASWDRDARERQRLLTGGATAGGPVSAGGLLLTLDDLSAVDGLFGMGSAGGGGD